MCFKKIPTDALIAHRAICNIDNALKGGDHQRLVKMTGVKSLLSCDVDEKYEDLKSSDLPLRKRTLETELCIVQAALILNPPHKPYFHLCASSHFRCFHPFCNSTTIFLHPLISCLHLIIHCSPMCYHTLITHYCTYCLHRYYYTSPGTLTLQDTRKPRTYFHLKFPYYSNAITYIIQTIFLTRTHT